MTVTIKTDSAVIKIEGVHDRATVKDVVEALESAISEIRRISKTPLESWKSFEYRLK